MKEICTTQVDNLTIEGIVGNYVFETIKKQNTFYENTLLQKWLPYLENSRIILDIGANLGNHTLFWGTHISYEKMYSFEPFPANYERLSNNILNNHLANIIPVPLGVGAAKGYSKVLEFTEDNYGATTFDTNISDTGEIQITDIDSFAIENNIPYIDFAKIDTEGFEESVLSGMAKTIAAHHPDLWIEVTENSFAAIMDLLLPLGYVLVDVVQFNMLFLFEGRHPGISQIDMQLVLKQMLQYMNWASKQRESDLHQLFDSASALKEQQRVLLRAKQTIQKQQQEIQLLLGENKRYRRRWNQFRSKWYGRLAYKIYRSLKRMHILK